MSFEVLDIVSLVIIIVVALQAMFKGFVKEFMSKAGIIVGFIIALMFSTVVAEIVDERFGLGVWSNLIAFAALFLGGFLLMKIISNMLRSILEGLHLTFIDNLLGFVLGLLEGAIIVSFMVYLLKVQSFIDLGVYIDQSWVVGLLEPIAPLSIEFFKENF